MWMKLCIIDDDKKAILFPRSFNIPQIRLNIFFGGKTVKSPIYYYDNFESDARFSRERPIKIKMTSKLKEKLLIPDSLVYQFIINNNSLKIGPVIAFLLGNYKYTSKYMKNYNDRLKIYNSIGGLIFAFSPESIDYENEFISGIYFNIEESKWESRQLPFPFFIYRRNFSNTSTKLINKLKSITRNKLYNSYRFSKIELYNLLSKNDEFKQYLPLTREINNFKQIKKFIENNQKSILKPIKSSRGRGIFIIDKVSSNNYELTIYNKSHILNKEDLQNILARNNVFMKKYLIQKYIQLATINGSVFDLRIVMQKIKPEKWICSGIEIRKARGKQHLTNISRGGTALIFEETMTKLFSKKESEKLRNNLLNISQDFCLILDKSEENYFEFGIDIAIDKNMNFWFLEANVLPSFKGFKKINYDNYLNILYNPLKYAIYKTDFEFKNINSQLSL